MEGEVGDKEMKILLADPIDKKALAELKKLATVRDAAKSSSVLKKEISKCDVLVVRSKTLVDEKLINKAKKLKAIVRAGVGLDNIDVDYAQEKGIKVLNTPEAPAISVAELTIALMLSLVRKVPQADSATKNKKWLKNELIGKELFGKTLGIVGFGRIGPLVAQRAKAFRMEILIYDSKKKPWEVKDFGTFVSLNELLKRSDIVTLHLPLTDETENMISDNEFKLMKGGAYLVNTARGPIIDEKALIKALKKGKISGAAFDVYWKETPFKSKLMKFKDKVVLMPHIGSQTKEAQERVGILLVERVKSLM